MDQHLDNFNPFVNPQDLENHGDFPDAAWLSRFDQHASLQSDTTSGFPIPNHQRTARNQDSAVDLTVYSDSTYTQVKTEDNFNAYIDDAYGTTYSTPSSNTPSPNDNPIFSNVNSPGDFTRSQSQTSSPDTSNDSDAWPAIHIPQSIDPLKCFIQLDKTKTRAETQIKTLVSLDPLPRRFQWVRFPRHTLSKSKQLASDEEVAANERKDGTARLQLTLVLATAVEKPEGLQRAYRRARGEEPTPRRQRGVAITEIDKADRTHPANGGAVTICEGCKEREAKRYNRKKKRNAEEEDEWNSYEDERIIMINEKEFKRWQDVEDDPECSPDAKKVEFAMRITCYCRHQEEKSPVGYRVVFTFTDVHNNVLAQQISDVIQITDDHKNKEIPIEAIPSSLNIPSASLESGPTPYTVPLYDYSTVYGVYSQPTTPSVPQAQSLTHSQSMFFARDGQYSQMTNCAFTPQVPPQSGMAFNGTTIPATSPAPQYPTHQRGQSYYNTPAPALISPTVEQMSPQAGFPLHRPHSLDSFPQWNFQFAAQQATYPQVFASQPPSRNPSRPASPSWDQGGRSTKKMRAVPGFMLYEDDEQ
ncbi:uncharacterized protein K460DRAFT_404978 [Cucurbitaria berberidis CBS 394.84]|uniref:SPT23/MGA2-like DNA-binding domain-containing protein n=1 Tax=Cucurbitaria berberidis CBS 394.84 TaxID=1168544 RepID=A0A9P4GFN5_9PLEO|nr:uncharacterized protein K460DRAFT_404978 [Cucurbitaria berberidis CBS 394.84]KAF1844695.1 hypothetical protein K460DRAFT_404978 [Cucurbitaria berberidis CBS 394.84]